MTDETLFHQARERDGADRAAFLDHACGSDVGLRRRIESLLQVHDNPDSFMAQPLVDAPATLELKARARAGSAMPNSADDEPFGRMIGRYKLLQPIGEGGFGVVYMAEQQEPVRRKVAVKIIKLGMDTKQVIARFEAERQALAMMDHPNIAKVLDAGATDAGRPYFVMELVRGVPLTEYCNANHLDTPQRLGLFVQVCQAVQHAHGKGIIHRDLKPTNVLITMNDDRPMPKVIDFGIAKAIHQRLTERTLFTEYRQMIGTPQYMSPEQAQMSAMDIDTRSDVYSLGVLLYELLTGTTPLDAKELRSAAYDQMQKMIREFEPPMPSTRLSTMGDLLATVAADRRTEPGKLSRLMKGELDWIVMKALEKDRTRRYDTASGMARDIERYLADETVEACPPSAWYRARKFARRNKTGIGIAALLLFFMVLLGGGVGWTARDRAVRQSQTGRQVRDSLASAHSLLAENKPAQARKKLSEAKAQLGQDRAGLSALANEVDAFDAQLARFERFFALLDRANDAQAPGESGMILTVVRSGGAIEASRSVSERNARGEVRYLLDALALYSVLDRDDWSAPLEHGDLSSEQVTQIRRAAYEALINLAGDIVYRQTDHRSGQTLSEEAAARQGLVYLQKAEAAHAPTSVLYWIRSQCWSALKNEEAARADEQRHRATPATIALDHYILGQQAHTARNKSQAVKEFEAALRLEPTHYWSLMWLGATLCDLGQGKEDFVGAAVAFTGCIALRPEHSSAYFNRGLAYSKLDRNEESLADDSRAIKLEPGNVEAWSSRGVAYGMLGQFDNAVTDLNKAIELDGKLARAWHNRGAIRDEQGQYEQAIADLSKAIEIDPKFSAAWTARGIIYAKINQNERSLADLTRAVDLNPRDAGAWSNRSMAYTELGQPDKALADASKAIGLDPDFAGAWANRGATYCYLKQWNDALANLNKAIELDPKAAVVWCNRGRVYANLKQWDRAFAELNKAIDLDPKLPVAWCGRGSTYSDLKQWEKAIADQDRAIELDPFATIAWCNRGSAYANLKQWDKAIADLNKAIELNPRLALAWDNLGATYADLKQWDKAIPALNEAIKLEPKLASAWGRRGSAYSDLKQWDKAAADLTRAIQLDSDDVETWNSRGVVRYRQGQYDKAIDDLNTAIKLDSQYASPWTNRGISYFALGQSQQALIDLSRAIELDPKDAANWNNRAAAYGNLGQRDKAIDDLSKVIELDPKNVDALTNQARLLAMRPERDLRDPARAVLLLRTALELTPENVDTWQMLGWALCQTGAWQESIESFRKSMALQETPKGGDSGQWFGLAAAYWQAGNKEESRIWYDRATDWMEKNAPKDELLIRFRAEAEEIRHDR